MLRLNPLHCGAVVASSWKIHDEGIPQLMVSIPFIAGQWSLLMMALCTARRSMKSQSPSLRGSGRFAGTPPGPAERLAVSIPFIAGQWSLQLDRHDRPARRCESQSPSLRGSGRFLACPSRLHRGRGRVSIPFIAGQWSLRQGGPVHRLGDARVSIPFIAGQWSLRIRPACGEALR